MHNAELKAVQSFLQTYINPFKLDRMKDNVLETLIKSGSEVLNIESDSKSFTHLTNQHAIIDYKPKPQQSKQPKSKVSDNPIRMPNPSNTKLGFESMTGAADAATSEKIIEANLLTSSNQIIFEPKQVGSNVTPLGQEDIEDDVIAEEVEQSKV